MRSREGPGEECREKGWSNVVPVLTGLRAAVKRPARQARQEVRTGFIYFGSMRINNVHSPSLASRKITRAMRRYYGVFAMIMTTLFLITKLINFV